MIHLIDGYAIKAESNCYIVGKPTEAVSKTTGKTSIIMNSPKYYSTLENAIKGFRRHLQNEMLAEFDGTLQEAMQALRDFDKEFNAALGNLDA